MRYFCSNQAPQACTLYHYLIADAIYQSDQYIPELPLTKLQCIVNKEPLDIWKKPVYPDMYCFDDQVVIGDKNYTLRLYKSPNAYRLEHLTDQYQITDSHIVGPLNEYDPVLLFGPALLLNLALNQVYCLHASAFMIKDCTFVVLGVSGTGKSTIAHYMHNNTEARRLADDILPLKMIKNKLKVLPHFPQLKLSVDQQYTGPERLGKVIFLFTEKHQKTTGLQPITAINTIKKLISHTVASKLFDRVELDRHLNMCHHASQQCQSYQLYYRHDAKSLSDLYQQLYDLC